MGKWRNIRKIGEPMPCRLEDAVRLVRPMTEEVRRRTGMQATVDVMRDELCFGFGEDAILAAFPLWRDVQCRIPCRFDPVIDGIGVDDVVRSINYQRVPSRVKERWRDHAIVNRRREDDEYVDQRLDDKTDDIRQTMHRTYERHAMGRHYRPSAVVNGLKGAS